MGIQYGELGVISDLEEFKFNIEKIDMDKVKTETVRVTANVMAKKVRDAVLQEPRINTGGSGPYERGEGPSMGTKDAWIVEPKSDDSFEVRPHPLVRQRAIVLNDGYPGTITPDGDKKLRFTVYGVPMFREEVSGPEATNYWRVAFQQMQKSREMEKIGERELRKEVGQFV